MAATCLVSRAVTMDEVVTHTASPRLHKVRSPPRTGYLMPDTTSGMRVLDAIGRPNVGLQLDLYHLQVCSACHLSAPPLSGAHSDCVCMALSLGVAPIDAARR